MDNRTAAKAEDNLAELASKNFELASLLVEEVRKLRLENAGLRVRVAGLEGVGELWRKAERERVLNERRAEMILEYREEHGQ